jgi:hypothetical protein
MTPNQQPDDNLDWEPPERRRPRRLDNEETAEVGFPIAWVLIGGLAGLLTIGLIGLGVAQIINKRAAPTATPPGLPTLALPATPTALPAVVETPTLAPAVSVPTPTPQAALPTATSQPAAAPTEIKVGGYVKIATTGGTGVSLRAGPGTNNARLLVVTDAEAVMAVVGGPKDDEQGEKDEAGQVYQWWYIRSPEGTEGWARADLLAASPPPAQ